MTLPRSCITCGDMISSGTRCRACGSTTARGYDGAWKRISARVIAEEGACRDCGTTGMPGNPLTCDHIIPKARGGGDGRENLCCRCRRCNSRKGARHPRVL